MAGKSASKETPLMKQYNQIKAKYPGAMLLFRVGDFYETFGEDAVTAAKVLDIVLTKRSNGAAAKIELAGFPHHALDTYLPKLVRAGYRVAICDQLEDPKSVKGIVKRGVTELVTPGLSFNDNVLDKSKNNFLASIHINNDSWGVAFLDLSTGEFLTAQGSKLYAEKLIQGFAPAEIIYNKATRKNFDSSFTDRYNTYTLEDWVYQFDFAYEKLTNHFKTTSLKGFGVEELQDGIVAAGSILQYLEDTEHRELDHISALSRIEEEKYVWLDRFTIRNLELIAAQQPGGVPLIDILDKTVSPMGARLLKKWLVLPLKDEYLISQRLARVELLVKDEKLREGIISHLKNIYDLERLISKVAVGRINPREMVQLKRSIENTQPIIDMLSASGETELIKIAERLSPCESLLEKIRLELAEDPPLNATQGGVIRDGVDEKLDELRKIAFSGKDYLAQIQQRETERTGIPSLKIAYNKVFGYYLEVTNTHKDKVPAEWIRKQTLVNCERYITEELKVYEEKILNAEDELHVIEHGIYTELIRTAAEYVSQIQENARVLAMLDCLASFAYLAIREKYVKPIIKDHRCIDIHEGRHPVIEKQLPIGEEYVPNDVFLDDSDNKILIITGPNMAGKSALLRQTALIVIMAQIGCFVPAKNAEIGIVDKIFTRVGASDNLSQGESTFMVEMTETASILNNLSDRSLVLMDEIGRGTSTYDGISIAWSIVEYLHNNNLPVKTLFATHYHELNQLADDFGGIKNFNVSVKEVGNKIIFMRKLKEGGSEHSFGIHVAQLAGMPNQVVLRAHEILQHLEKDKLSKNDKDKFASVPKNNYQLSMFEADPAYEEVKGLIDGLDINTISPVEALLKLNEIKMMMKKD
ncbi:DNA mismatch repair protein MutS [Marinigracilibium pacificum]|uniref:DNA mismatch repair protein MutS n=1 Tax=Marinigracilibium pacificum TaxID=2729599 RepID=A0A848IRG4_9BACT|nr:DNA mismatch repair protein MutS [Marinigracilibium pacificum]NMM47063.1 DNA mismatch repair protein MutS [Marinigracilibium pacificum]